MTEPIATLNDGGPADTETVGVEPRQHSQGATMKFAYASGSRPLDGYTIKRGIGVGGFGEVYFATSDAGKEVALKRIQRNLDIELRGVRQCLNLKHHNLISLWDIKYDEQDQAWVVMEYVCGESLKDVVDRYPSGMPIDEVHEWFDGIAAGVKYLHDHGIVHRDLKPGNIFEDDSVVKIGDYGLSKFISTSRRSGQTESVGTFHYMAPEIGKGIYGKEIDVYALGIILYEMLTGLVPFDGESSQEIMMKHLTADPDVSAVSEPYRGVIQKAMAKDPDLRYSDVSEMLADLQRDKSKPDNRAATTSPKPSIPPVQPLVITDDDDDDGPLYITDDERDEMVMGDVNEVVEAEPIPDSPRQAPVNPRPNEPRGETRNEAVAAPVPRDEPIAKVVRGGWGSFRDWWQNANFSNPAKVGLVIVAAIILLLNAEWLIPLGVVVGAIYLIYYGIRVVALRVRESRSKKEIKAGAVRENRPMGRIQRWSTKEMLQRFLQQRTVPERLSELTGSMIMAVFVSAVLCLVMVVVGDASFDSIGVWSFYTWLTATSVTGAWIVLAIGKFYDGTKSEQVRRRFVMLVAGLILGAAAFGYGQVLAAPLEIDTSARPLAEVYELPASMVQGGELQLPAYLAFFGGIFFILCWWKQADPLRRTRLSLWATAACVLWALIIDVFPVPWGFMLAATISVAVQLSAPWMNPKQRAEIRQQYEEV